MKKRVLVFIAVIAAIGFALWLASGKRASATSQVPQERRTASPATGRSEISPGKSISSPAVSRMSPEKAEMAGLIIRALDALRQGRPDEADMVLARLDGVLGNRQDTAAAIAAIVEFLGTGQDARTGKGFVIGEGGVLAEATTLRVYLMDKLGRLCREAGSGEALQVAQGILRDFGSVDEWAVSMRNVAWSDPDSREFLQDRVNAMLTHPEWSDHPTTGMLEAFDVIVHSGALVTVPELGRLISVAGSPLARASGVALDRLATGHALELTSLLNRKPELLSVNPLERADLFAHASLGVPEQRQQLEIYLLRADVDSRERKKFLGSLVQTGRFVSHNLITPYIPPESPEQAAPRLELLVRTVNEWTRDERFNFLRGELTDLGNTVNRIIDEIAADVDAGDSK